MRITQRVQEVVEADRIEWVCDFCKKPIAETADDERAEVTIQGIFGARYPSGDFSEILYMDACPACFAGKVKPALELAGGTWRKRHTDEGPLRITVKTDPLGPKKIDCVATEDDFPEG